MVHATVQRLHLIISAVIHKTHSTNAKVSHQTFLSLLPSLRMSLSPGPMRWTVNWFSGCFDDASSLFFGYNFYCWVGLRCALTVGQDLDCDHCVSVAWSVQKARATVIFATHLTTKHQDSCAFSGDILTVARNVTTRKHKQTCFSKCQKRLNH